MPILHFFAPPKKESKKRGITAQGNYSSRFYWFKYSWCAPQLLRTTHSHNFMLVFPCLPAGRLSVQTHFRCFVRYYWVQRPDLINTFSLQNTSIFLVQPACRRGRNLQSAISNQLWSSWFDIPYSIPPAGEAGISILYSKQKDRLLLLSPLRLNLPF